MEILYLLEDIRNPVFDVLFSVITRFGEETLFMAFGMIIFWCIDKYQGYYLLCTGFLGTVVNQFLKMFFRVPRPWVKDPSFNIVGSAKEAAGGYSFPSGHTQTSVGLYGGMARWNKHKVLRIIAIILCVLVPFSRLYLGVHTLADVLVSLCIATLFVFVGYPIFKKAAESPKVMYTVLTVLTLVMVGYLLFVCLYNFPPSVYTEENIHNLESARKNGFTLLGCLIGLIVAYTMDIKFIHFETKAVWWAQIIKAVVGIGLVIAAKEGLRIPLEIIFQNPLVARCIRYFLMVIVGGAVWPLTFKWFSKLGKGDTKNEI